MSLLVDMYIIFFLLLYLPQNFKVEVLGVDLSKNMIDIGIQRAKEFKDDKVMHCKKLFFSLCTICYFKKDPLWNPVILSILKILVVDRNARNRKIKLQSYGIPIGFLNLHVQGT